MLPSLGDFLTKNQLLSILDIQKDDRIVSITEKGDVSGQFILADILKDIYKTKDRVCLILFHDDFNHYQALVSKFGFSLSGMVKSKRMTVIDGVTAVAKQLIEGDIFDLNVYLESICSQLKATIAEYAVEDEEIHIFIEDITHLSDLGVELKWILNFLNYCVNLTNEQVHLVASTHVASKTDAVISNYVRHVCDLDIEVTELVTGKSVDVSGHLYVERPEEFTRTRKEYLYRNFERGTKVFLPGESVFNLRR